MDPVVFTDRRSGITVTLLDIVCQRRVAGVNHAAEADNLSEAARLFGV